MHRSSHSDRFRFGTFELDAGSGELFKNGHALSLQPQPFRVLQLLVSRAGELVTRDELRQALWPDGTTVDFDQGLNYCIRQIRGVLGESAGEPRFIETLPKRGYRFIAQLEQPPEAAPKPGFRYRRHIAVAAAAVVSLSIYLLARTTAALPQTILVRPFVGLGLSAEEAWYADALTQQLIGELARTRKVRVLPWSTSLALKSQPASVRELSQRFGAEAILEGSIRREGKSLGVTAQLVDSQTERVLWSHRDQRESNDLGKLETELLASIAQTLKFRIEDQNKSASNRKRLDVDTYNMYLKAASMKDQLSPNGAAKSVTAFEEVIRRAPDHAPAYAGLANTWATLPFIRNAPTKDTLQKAAEIAKQAIALDPSLAEAHAALAHSYFNLWKWKEAEKEFQTALSLDPDSATTLQLYAIYLATQGRFDEALTRAESAARLAPTSGLMANTIALVHFHAGHFDEAIAASQRTLDVDPGSFGTYLILSRAYAIKGMHREAVEAHTKLEKGTEGRTHAPWAAHLKALSGNRKEALETLKGWEQGIGSKGAPPVAYGIALLDCGEEERGFNSLQQAVKTHLTASIWLKAMPELKKWRSDPRYLSTIALLDQETKN